MTTPDAAAIADEIERELPPVHRSGVRTGVFFDTPTWCVIIAALRSSSAATAPGHTDLMVPPETIGPWMEDQELVDQIAAVTAERDALREQVNPDDLLSGDACAAIREVLIAADVPIAAFIDDHVRNAIVQRNQAREECAALSKRVEELIGALTQAAEHFDGIEHKAEHWRAVVQKNEIAEERWVGIRNYARHRARVCRAALAQPKGDCNGPA